MSARTYPVPRAVVPAGALIGALGLAACLVGALLGNPARALGSYLLAFSYWLSLSLGALAVLVILLASGARWAAPLQRLLEVLSLGVTLAPPLLLPILVWRPLIYPWARPGFGPRSAEIILTLREPYLTTPFFVARSLLYVACWCALAVILHRWSRLNDDQPSARLAHHQRALASAGAPLLLFSVTWATYDWLMSLTPDWASELYGAYFLGGALVVGLAQVIPLAVYAHRDGLKGLVPDLHLANLGKLLLAAVCVWAYLAFDQYLLIWMANLPEEIGFYLERTERGWRPVFVALIALNFVLPFALLLGARAKRDPRLLSSVGGLLLVAHALDLFWLVVPALGDRRPRWTDLAAFLGVGGLHVAFVAWRLSRTPAVAVGSLAQPARAAEGA